MQYTVDGLVIREGDAGENDKRLVLLTPDRGRISVLEVIIIGLNVVIAHIRTTVVAALVRL